MHVYPLLDNKKVAGTSTKIGRKVVRATADIPYEFRGQKIKDQGHQAALGGCSNHHLQGRGILWRRTTGLTACNTCTVPTCRLANALSTVSLALAIAKLLAFYHIGLLSAMSVPRLKIFLEQPEGIIMHLFNFKYKFSMMSLYLYGNAHLYTQI